MTETRFHIGTYQVLLRDGEEYCADWTAGEGPLKCYAFQTPQWQLLWRDTVGASEQPILVTVLDASNKIVMLVQLSIRTERGSRVLDFAGGSTIDYHAPVVNPDAPIDEKALAHILREIYLAYRVDVVQFRRMPEKIEQQENPFVRLRNAIHDEEAHFALLPKTFEAFEGDLGANFRKELRRRKRRLEERGDVRFEVCDDQPALNSAMEVLVAQKTRRWRETGSKKYMSDSAREFYQRLAKLKLHNGRGLLCCLKLDGQIVATLLGVLYRERFISLLSGFEAGEFEKYSLGRVLKEYVVKWCIAQNATVFDLTAGDEPYKRDWAKNTMSMYSLNYGVTWRGKLHVAPIILRKMARKIPIMRRIRDEIYGGIRRIRPGSISDV